MVFSPGLLALVDDGAILSSELQARLDEQIGPDPDWSADASAGVFLAGGAEYPMQLLGSTAPVPQSWLWSWASTFAYPETVTRAAAQARALGEQYGIPELVGAEIPLHTIGEVVGADRLLGDRLAIAAGVAARSLAVFSGEIGGGTRVWLLAEGVALGEATVRRVREAIDTATARGLIHDPNRALSSYAALRALPWDGVRFSCADGTLAVSVDPSSGALSLFEEGVQGAQPGPVSG